MSFLRIDVLRGGRALRDDTLNRIIDDPAMRHAPFVYSDHPSGRRVAEVLRDMLGKGYVVQITEVCEGC